MPSFDAPDTSRTINIVKKMRVEATQKRISYSHYLFNAHQALCDPTEPDRLPGPL